MPSSWSLRRPDDFSVDVRRNDTTMSITLSGELDLASGPDLLVAVEGAAADVDIVLDVTGLVFIDAAGLRYLLGAIGKRSVRVVNMQPAVRRLFDLTHMDQVFDYTPRPPVTANGDDSERR